MHDDVSIGWAWRQAAAEDGVESGDEREWEGGEAADETSFEREVQGKLHTELNSQSHHGADRCEPQHAL